ncbi:hypothetical protein CAEBREN_10956 [Caenorhabditis brenneri]|uniref:Uncharacterized protein n=1 Tax=Caenorhabditis brenneri TaxID=135651 RepID=G0N4A9_CAEBE|nr:hypothetical protein CAEBREN_10956 [Caenorhabditis brenneri]
MVSNPNSFEEKTATTKLTPLEPHAPDSQATTTHCMEHRMETLDFGIRSMNWICTLSTTAQAKEQRCVESAEPRNMLQLVPPLMVLAVKIFQDKAQQRPRVAYIICMFKRVKTRFLELNELLQFRLKVGNQNEKVADFQNDNEKRSRLMRVTTGSQKNSNR